MDGTPSGPRNSPLEQSVDSLQCTVRSPMAASGPSRCGRPSRLRLTPAPAGTGIEFLRRDLPAAPPLRACLERLRLDDAGLVLQSGPVRVAGALPLLAAAAGLAIDNLRVELDGETLPLLDGSAAPFVFLLQSAGIQRQSKARRWLEVRRSLERSRSGLVRIAPYPGLRLNHAVGAPPVGSVPSRPLSIAGRGTEFLRELCRARWPDEAGGPPRFADEAARRELLDAAALLALLDAPVLGELTLQGADRRLLVDTLRALHADETAFGLVGPGDAVTAAARAAGQAA